MYYNYRHYDVSDGKWLSRDLILEEGGYNLNSFNNNSIIYTDLKGNIIFGKTVKIHPQLERKPYRGKDVCRPKRDNWQAVIDAIDSDVYCWQCIKQLNIKIHGNPYMAVITDAQKRERIASGDLSVDNTMNLSNVDIIINQLLKQETFCSECTIFLLSCNVGLSTFAQNIAEKTRCTVYAPMGYIYGDLHDPISSRIVREVLPYYPPYEGAKDNTFKVFYPDGRRGEYNNRP